MKTQEPSGGSRLRRFAVLLALVASPSFAQNNCNVKANISPNNLNIVEGQLAQFAWAPQGSFATPTGYAWSQTGGPAVTLIGATSANVSFVAPQVGPNGDRVDLQLVVTGCTSPVRSNTAATKANVSDFVPTNYPPAASAIATPNPALENEIVALDGSASSDPDAGDVLGHAWSQVGGSAVTLSNANTAIASFTAPNTSNLNGESLTFRLTVTDGDGLSDSTEEIVNILWANDSPVAALSCPVSVDEGSLITLDGSASSDSDDGIASYSWIQVNGPPNIDLSGFSGDSASFTAPQLGLQQTGFVPFKLVVTDAGGLSDSAQCTVQILDVTPPGIIGASDTSAEATGPDGAIVLFSVSAFDAVDGALAASCVPDSGSTFALGATAVTCSATDSAGNTGSDGFTVTVVDTTPPVIQAHADVTAFATSASGAVVNYTLPTANDLVDGVVAVTCLPASGSQFAIGSTAIHCSASDSRGNTATSTFNVIVSFDFNGFFRPVDNLPVVNRVKAGSAIPVKFSLGGDMGLAIMAAGFPRSVQMTCNGTAEDAIEETSTAGGSSLAYDPANGQYIYVWKSEKSWAGTCRQLQVKLADGSVRSANFSFTR